MVRWVGVLMALLLIGGCGSVGGEPGAEPTGLVLPPRPRDLRIDGVEPCSLLTERQRVELGLDGRPSSSTKPSVLFGGDEATCTLRGFQPKAVSVGLGLVATTGIERFSGGHLEANVSPTTVGGFPAVVMVPKRSRDYCSVLVDVAPGQLIDIQYADGGRQPPIPQTLLCDHGQRLAAAVIGTLLSQSR